MKKFKSIVWGIILVALGVLWCLDVVGVMNFTLFFDGWWTLIIIIPSFIDLVTEKDKTGSIIGLSIGVLLLLACRDIIDFGMIFRLIVPTIVVAVGVGMIWNSLFGRRARAKVKRMKMNKPEGLPEYCATFSGVKPNLDDKVFEGCEITAVFGGVELDLSRTHINEDVYIELCCVFGGAKIKLPEGVNLKLSTTGILGGISDKHRSDNSDTAATVYIDGTCMFGGAEIT